MAGFGDSLKKLQASGSKSGSGKSRARQGGTNQNFIGQATYEYVAVSSAGLRHKGKMQATSQRAVAEALQSDGWMPLEIKESRQSGLNKDLSAMLTGGEQKIRLTAPEAAGMFRQISELLKAGVPITRVLQALTEEASPKIKNICTELSDRLTAGVPLSEAMLAFPDAFDSVTRAYVAAGEASGTLAEAMSRLARILEKKNEMRLKIKAVTAYPKMVGFAIAGIVAAILIFLVPRYQAIYADFGSELPLPTRILVAASDNLLPVHIQFSFPTPYFLTPDFSFMGLIGRVLFLAAFMIGTDALRNRSGKEPKAFRTAFKWIFALAITLFAQTYSFVWLSAVFWILGVALWVGFRWFFSVQAEDAKTIEFVDKMRFRFPIFGPIIEKNALFQWSSTMAGALSSGVPQVQAIGLAGETAGSRWHEYVSKDLQAQVRAGKPLSEALAMHPKLYPPSLRAMVATGEATGDMDAMFDTIANTIDGEIDALVAGLSAKVEVALLLVMAAVVGGLLIALYLPIIKLATTVGGGING